MQRYGGAGHSELAPFGGAEDDRHGERLRVEPQRPVHVGDKEHEVRLADLYRRHARTLLLSRPGRITARAEHRRRGMRALTGGQLPTPATGGRGVGTLADWAATPSSTPAALRPTGRQRMTTPRAATHNPQPVLPRRPPRSHTGTPGTAVARMSPWLVRYSALTTSPLTPSQRGSTPLRTMITLRVTDQAMTSSWPRCSPSSAPPYWCWAVQAAFTAAWVTGSPVT